MEIIFRPFKNEELSKIYDYCDIKINARNKDNLDDELMGLSEKNLCSKCEKLNDCYGHPGALPLKYWIINPMYVKPLCNLMKLICVDCKHLSSEYKNNIWDIDDTLRLKRECLNPEHSREYLPSSVKFVAKREIGNKIEYHINWGSKKTRVDNDLVKMLSSISDEQAEEFGFKGGARPEDMLMKYILIVPPRIRPDLKKKNDIKRIYESILKIGEESMEKYQFRVHELLHEMLFNSESDNSLKKVLSGKKGLLRGSVMSKRVDNCLRSVLSPDPFINITKITVPQVFVKELDYEDDFYVIFNRQPTLSMFSMMALKAKSSKDKLTLSFNPLLSKPFNADFDGDESNCHVCTSEEAKREAEELMSVDKCLKYSNNSSPTFPLIQDSLLAAYILTEECYVPSNVFDICIGHRHDKSESGRAFKIRLMRNKQKLTKDGWPGRALYSASLPRYFYYSSDTLEVKEGVLIRGQINKETSNELLNEMTESYFDGTVVCNYLSSIQAISSMYLHHRAVTISIRDCYNDEKIKDVEKSIYDNLEIAHNKLAKLPEYLKEDFMFQLTRSQRGNVFNKLKKDKLKKAKNGLEQIVYSGAKGDLEHIIQIVYMLGQQVIGEGRPKKVTVHHDIDDLKARGLCTSSLSEGLTTKEAYVHYMACRESLVLAGMQTPESGYTERSLVKFLENNRIAKDGTVRNNRNEIIQMLPNTLGIDPKMMYKHEEPISIDNVLSEI